VTGQTRAVCGWPRVQCLGVVGGASMGSQRSIQNIRHIIDHHHARSACACAAARALVECCAGLNLCLWQPAALEHATPAHYARRAPHACAHMRTAHTALAPGGGSGGALAAAGGAAGRIGGVRPRRRRRAPPPPPPPPAPPPPAPRGASPLFALRPLVVSRHFSLFWPARALSTHSSPAPAHATLRDPGRTHARTRFSTREACRLLKNNDTYCALAVRLILHLHLSDALRAVCLCVCGLC
jgi:hypothetical protein